MSVLLSPAYLRTYLVVLLTGYFAFIFQAWLIDRSLAAFCRRAGINKPQAFIFSSYVNPSEFKAFRARLTIVPTAPPHYLKWLGIWAFMSQVFFGLCLIFVVLSVTSIVEHRS